MEDKSLKSKLARYMDAGFPIIYINTYEEDKVDAIVQEISFGKEVYEWNETNGYIDFETKTAEGVSGEDCTLERMLDQLKTVDLLDRKIILLKDITSYLDDSKIVSKIKGIARMINQGADATILIISPIVVIPKDLEKFITILEMDYLNTEEIQHIIRRFIQDNAISQVIEEELIDELSLIHI